MNVSRVGDPGVCFPAVDIVSLCTSLMGKQLTAWPELDGQTVNSMACDAARQLNLYSAVLLMIVTFYLFC